MEREDILSAHLSYWSNSSSTTQIHSKISIHTIVVVIISIRSSSSSSKYITRRIFYISFYYIAYRKKIAVLFSSVFFNINHLIVFFFRGVPIVALLSRCDNKCICDSPRLNRKNVFTFFSRLCINIFAVVALSLSIFFVFFRETFL